MKKSLFTLTAIIAILPGLLSQNSNDCNVFKTESKFIYDICFTPNGGALAIADNETIKAYSTNSKMLLREFTGGHTKQILSIDISNDSTLLVSGGKDSTVVIWDFINNKILNSLNFHKGIITSLQISPDNKYLLSGATDNNVYLYDLQLKKVIHEFTEHTDDITSVQFSPDGSLIANASGDKLIKLYDTNSKKLITTLKGHKSWVRDISFSPDQDKLYSCGDDSKVIIWDISDLKNIHLENVSKNTFGWLLDVDINEDSVTYVTGNIHGKLTIFTQLYTYTENINKPVQKVKFKPKETPNLIIVLATLGKGVLMIDAKEMKLKVN